MPSFGKPKKSNHELVVALLASGFSQSKTASLTGYAPKTVEHLAAKYRKSIQTVQDLSSDFSSELKQKIPISQLIDGLQELTTQMQHPMVRLKAIEACVLWYGILNKVQEGAYKRDIKEPAHLTFAPMITVDTRPASTTDNPVQISASTNNDKLQILSVNTRTQRKALTGACAQHEHKRKPGRPPKKKTPQDVVVHACDREEKNDQC